MVNQDPCTHHRQLRTEPPLELTEEVLDRPPILVADCFWHMISK
jgi:hypothetical protein